MVPASRADAQTASSLTSASPIPESSSAPSRSPFNAPKAIAVGSSSLATARVGAGSPLHEQASRLFPKRTRELQSATGLSPSIWGPPTSGTSTPLFEIPESPNQDGFPDLIPLTETGINSPARRGRAGTLPSRISPLGTINGINVQQLTSKTSRPTPSTSPFRPGSTSAAEIAFHASGTNPAHSALLSRLRSGSTPQRSNLIASVGTYGQSAFSTGWASRSRAATLTSIQSAEDPTSPQQISFAKDGMTDSGVRTLDYLGLADTPHQSRSDSSPQIPDNVAADLSLQDRPDALANFNLRNSNRFRSFSVNTQPKSSIEGGDNAYGMQYYPSGTLTPSAAAALEAEYERVQEKVRMHNQAVQAFAVNANAARPRARTAGLVETPQRTAMRNYAQIGEQDSIQGLSDVQTLSNGHDVAFDESFQGLTIGGNVGQTADNYEDNDTQISRSLWIGSIPNSTTMSSLDAIFNHYGPIESTRVLTHKNCGFVNFESVEHAVRARQLLNGKEIFPGAGPVRIGYAKAPTTSISMTPAQNTLPPSPNAIDKDASGAAGNGTDIVAEQSLATQLTTLPTLAKLTELHPEILRIVQDFGAQQDDLSVISSNVEHSILYSQLEKEIPPVTESSPDRVYDAPKLRDIRKRIDNGACGLQEIEQIAIDMLPEIAELASDYLGNTVVQKLFEFCSEQVKEQMLVHIAPHLAEIGIHKNGTWAAQKIIEVCKTDIQTRMIVDSLRPYTVPLFLDQYGNYVLQCCLKFGAPYNDFMFETMLSQLWEVAQGRFGSRAMRACLESHHATKHQQRMLAAMISLCSVQLATSANGALLLTWLLDTCTFPRRRSVLAPYLVPHLVRLCTHKVAYLTVLKVVGQRNEPEARDLILKALFFNPDESLLEQILHDQTSGVTFIFKILTTPFLDDAVRPEIVRNIAKVLVRIKAQPNQGYKRLMDEVGLSSRSSQPNLQQFQNHGHPANHRQRQMQAGQMDSMMQNQNYQRQNNNNFMSDMNVVNYENGLSPIRSGSADSFGYPTYPINGYGAQHTFGQMPFQQMNPQSNYQSYSTPNQRSNGNAYMPNGYAGFTPQLASVDAYRMHNQSASPVPYATQMSPIMNSGGFVPQNFGQNGNGNMYNYPSQQQQYYYSSPAQPVHAGRGRRR